MTKEIPDDIREQIEQKDLQINGMRKDIDMAIEREKGLEQEIEAAKALIKVYEQIGIDPECRQEYLHWKKLTKTNNL